MISNASSHSWIVLMAGAVLLLNVISGVATGSAITFYRRVKKSEDPLLYWFAIVLSAVLGVGAVLSFVVDHK